MTYYETYNLVTFDDNWFTIETGADIEQVVSDTCVCDSLVQFGNLMFARSYSRRPSRASLITSISSAAVCSCSVIAVLVLHCAFVRHVRGHSEFLCHIFQ